MSGACTWCCAPWTTWWTTATRGRHGPWRRWRRGPRVGRSRGRCAAILDDLAKRHPGFPRDAVTDFAAGMRADLAGPGPPHRGGPRPLLRPGGGHRRADDGLGPGRGARPRGGRGCRRPCARDGDAAHQHPARSRGGRARGRVYLPHSAFHAVGLTPEDGTLLLADLLAWPPETRAAFLGRQAVRAEAEYALGLAGVRHLRHGRRAVLAAGLMYREILRQIEREDHGGRRARVVVPRWRKLLLVTRALAIGR